MSVEQAKLFIERMKTDEAFRSQIIAVEDVAERMRMVNAGGYDFTEDEMKAVLAEVGDEAVEGVAGGYSTRRYR